MKFKRVQTTLVFPFLVRILSDDQQDTEVMSAPQSLHEEDFTSLGLKQEAPQEPLMSSVKL